MSAKKRSGSRSSARKPAPARTRHTRIVLAVTVVLAAVLFGAAWWMERAPAEPPRRSLSAPGGFVPPVAEASPVVPAGSPSVPIVDPAWVAQIATSTGIPQAALTAYAVAELRITAEQPQCAVGWSTLAGIGWVESRHGTINGAVLGLDGVSAPPIVGPALDGANGFAAIESHPDLVQWHGDERWDHAVGPMQFIGSTWARWRSDGDGDGVMDPNDIDDAAYAAARYLCHDGFDLATGEGWSSAILGYNRDDAYVTSVYAAATEYARLSE